MSGNFEHTDPLDQFSGSLQPQPGRSLQTSGSATRSIDVVTDGAMVRAPSVGTIGLTAWLWALRRRWLLAFSLGLLGSAALGVPAWFYFESEYVASAQLLVRAHEPSVVFAKRTGATLQDFEVYKRSQQQRVVGRFVLSKALRQPGISHLKIVEEQIDPVKWLQEELSVRYPGSAEIMEVSLKGEDPSAIAKIVNAVTQAYMDEVVNKKKEEGVKDLEGLTKMQVAKDEDLRTKRKRLEDLARGQSSSDSAVLALKQQVKLQQYSQLQQKLIEIEFELMEEKTQLQVGKATVEAQGGPTISEADLEAAIEQDPTVAPLIGQLRNLRDQYDAEMQILKNDSRSRVKPQIAEIEKRFKKRRDEVRKRILDREKERYANNLKVSVQQSQAHIKILEAQRDGLQKNVNQLQQQFETIGQSTVGIEMLKSEVDRLSKLVGTIQSRIDTLRVELGAPARVEWIEHAVVPKTKDIKKTVQVTAFMTLIGFAVPVLGVSWLEVRSRRIHTTTDVAEGLGMRVIGAVPSLKSYGRKRIGRKGGRQADEYWNGILRESVDGIRTMLLRQADPEAGHAVLVTSAVAGEGKTSLATQLAMSFARAGRKTLLVDCDFRKPGAHLAFSLPVEPGLCDVLRGEKSLAEGIVPTPVEKLWMLPAGQSGPQAFGALSQGALEECFEDLKQEYDFIVVDGAPVLPIVDTMIVAQYVDYAVLSVLCDVSQSPRVFAASEKLSTVGVRVLGTVVSAVSEDLYTMEHYPVAEVEPQPIATETVSA